MHLSYRTTLRTLLTSGLLALALVACGRATGPETAPDGFVQAPHGGLAADVDPGLEAAAILDEVTLANGNTLRFIDESVSGVDGGIGMLEVIAPDATSVLATIREQKPTPLEVFLSMVPGRPAPAALIAHHESLASARGLDPAPRTLSYESPEVDSEPRAGGVLWSWCTNDSVFRNSYLNNLHWPNGFKHFGFGADMTGTHYGVTGFANDRALSVCNHPNASSNTRTSVWKRIGASTWVYIAGTSYNMIPHRGMWYASSDPGFQVASQYRVRASGGYYSIAGSWGM